MRKPLLKGDTHKLDVSVTREVPNDDPVQPSTIEIVDLSGSVKIWFTAKRQLTDADLDAVIRKGTSNTGLTGIVVLTPGTDGKARITLAPADSSGLERGTVWLYYDIQLLELDGTLTTITSGRMAWVDDATRASS